MKSPFTLLCGLSLIADIFAFRLIILTHLGPPLAATGLYGVPQHSSAQWIFAAWWIFLWLTCFVSAWIAVKHREPLCALARVSVIFHAFPIVANVWGLLHSAM